MTSDSSISHRVSRLENDTQSIYELLADLKATQDAHTQRLDSIDTVLADHTQRLDSIDTRLDSIDTTLTEVLRRLPDPGKS